MPAGRRRPVRSTAAIFVCSAQVEPALAAGVDADEICAAAGARGRKFGAVASRSSVVLAVSKRGSLVCWRLAARSFEGPQRDRAARKRAAAAEGTPERERDEAHLRRLFRAMFENATD